MVLRSDGAVIADIYDTSQFCGFKGLELPVEQMVGLTEAASCDNITCSRVEIVILLSPAAPPGIPFRVEHFF